MRIKKAIVLLCACFSFISSSQVFAENYFAVDAAYMKIKTIYQNGSTPFEMQPVRLKFGKRYEELGWEINLVGPADDTGAFTAGGTDLYEIRYGLGLMFTASSKDRRYYGGIGYTLIDAEYSVLSGGVPAVSTASVKPFITLNFGMQFGFGKNLRATIDYTFYHGDIDCNFCIATSTNTVDPDVRINTLAVGLSYSFR